MTWPPLLTPLYPRSLTSLKSAESVAAAVTSLLSPRGIQQYVLKGAFETLTAYTSNFLAKLSSDTLRLSLECDDGAKIQRTAEVYEDGRWVPRSLGR